MHPTTSRSNRSSLHHPRLSPIPAPSTTSSVYHQQQQQIVYTPVSKPMVTLQPCGTAFHLPCIYPSIQPHVDPSHSAPLYPQGKSNRWNIKNKASCGQQYYQQQHQVSYNPKPVAFLDQPSNSVASITPSTTSFLLASSTFTHSSLPGEHYNNISGVTHLLPQSYFKPSDVQQTFCLIQDRQNLGQQQQQHPIQTSYYNISTTNACSLQTINANPYFALPNFNPYTSLTTFTTQLPASVQSSSHFSSSPVGLVITPSRDKSLPTLEFSPFKRNASKISSICESRVVPVVHNEISDWSPQIETSSKYSYDPQIADNNLESADCSLRKSISAKTEEEHYSDESSTSFDFTIEAEKMVSALCNTTSSNDLSKESKAGKTDSTSLFSGAGDNMSNKTTWFTDFCSEYENGTSIGVQTDCPCVDRSQYPELIRKVVFWGCTEAESILDSESSQVDTKRSWLTCLSTATKTAITKSSTCIPVFAGDRVFVDDLINALLRISNGWLSLDNYLNKQHFPNLLDRLDPELIECFHAWEENTHVLLKLIVETFQKFDRNHEAMDVEQKRKEICESSSFPGDVSLYVNHHLLIPTSSGTSFQRDATEKAFSQEIPHCATSTPLSTGSLRSFQLNSDHREQHSASHKESKLRSKWTITDNLSSAISTTKSVPNVSVRYTDNGNLVSSKFRAKDTFSSKKFDFTQKSLNAEFCQLRNQVMESNADAMKDKRQDYAPETKLAAFTDKSQSVRLQHPMAMCNPSVSYRGLYAQNCMSFTFPLSGQSNISNSSTYPSTIPNMLTYGGPNYPSALPSVTDSVLRGGKTPELVYGMKSPSVSQIYASRSQAEQLEPPTVPRNKMTLLSQIEPKILDYESKEMAANLSAWFASMRNVQPPTTASTTFEETKMNENPAPRLFAQQEMSKYSANVSKPLIDANRQFQALQNLPNIQSTPWAAANFISGRPQVQRVFEEYDSSEDVRVYMKPGSYNVPKKRHQRRSNRRSDSNATSRSVHANNHHNAQCVNKGKSMSMLASSTPLSHQNAPANLSANAVSNATLVKTSFPSASQLPAPLFNPENSPRILKRTDSLSQDTRRDVTWKAACASAEILLETLNTKDCANTIGKIGSNCSNEKNDRSKDWTEELPLLSQQSDAKSMKRENVDCASSYEASEDDSGSTCRLSPSTSVVSLSQSREDENALSTKTNVKTDSWLIRTLNNASIVSKQKRRKDNAIRRSSGSSNSSIIIDVKPTELVSPFNADANAKAAPALITDREYPAILARKHPSHTSYLKNDERLAKELEGHIGKATYSETVRRSIKSDNARSGKKESCKTSAGTLATCVTAISIPGRRYQGKEQSEQSYQLLYKSQRSDGKKIASNDVNLEEESCAKVSSVKICNAPLKSLSGAKTHGKKKETEHLEGKCSNKSGDRGWSVWYSSRRKQSLSPLAFSKLETIHRTVWQTDEAKIFKCPYPCGDKDDQSSSALESYRKVKKPMFLEIVDYKLKNRVYHKVEHAVKDFRRIIHSARLYHQHDDERVKKIEVLSRKLEDLLEEHFGNWDLDNVTGSPREDTPLQSLKTSVQKSTAGRQESAKKSTSSFSLTSAEKNTSH